MTARDRMVLAAVLVIVLLGGGWIAMVSPERKKASSLVSQVNEARSQLNSAETKLSGARAAQAQYATAYASLVSLGKAVPASQEVPALMVELAQASNEKNVEFSSITATATGGSSSPTPAATVVASAGFSQMPFTFIFNGSFFSLERLFEQLNGYTVRTAAGDLKVSGRLLTIQGVKLAPLTTPSEEASGKSSAARLTGTITATAYVLPTGEGLTGGATPSSPTPSSAAPASSSSPSSATPSSSSAASSSSSAPGGAPAVIGVTR
jgi:hypothetical protein